MTTIHEMAQAATESAADVKALIEAQAQESAQRHRCLMDAFDELDGAFAKVWANLPKPQGPTP